jgi:hypothetical protein
MWFTSCKCYMRLSQIIKLLYIRFNNKKKEKKRKKKKEKTPESHWNFDDDSTNTVGKILTR